MPVTQLIPVNQVSIPVLYRGPKKDLNSWPFTFLTLTPLCLPGNVIEIPTWTYFLWNFHPNCPNKGLFASNFSVFSWSARPQAIFKPVSAESINQRGLKGSLWSFYTYNHQAVIHCTWLDSAFPPNSSWKFSRLALWIIQPEYWLCVWTGRLVDCSFYRGKGWLGELKWGGEGKKPDKIKPQQ